MAAPVQTFSPNGKYLAFSGPDGVLKLWDTTSGILSIEYTPSAHLYATCSCLAWTSISRSHVKRRKRRKHKTAELDVIAMGTVVGSILLFDVSKADIQNKLELGHTDRVNCLCWNKDATTLYSCSNDSQIIEWDMSTGTKKSKWKGDKGHIFSISLSSNEQHLLTASRSIKLWDLATKECLKVFTGHATEVFQLKSLPMSSECDLLNGLSSQSSSYFISAAADDRFLNAWHINSTSKDKGSTAAFSLPEEASSFTVSNHSFSDKPVLLAAVTSSGKLVMFEHVPNGKCKKPIIPKKSLQVAGSDGNPKPIPILSVHICDDNEQNILIMHGSFLKPKFEKLSYKSIEPEMCLIRGKVNNQYQPEADVTKVKIPDTSKEVTTLAPGYMVPALPSTSTKSLQLNRKKRKNSGELTMEDRLDALGLDKSSNSDGASEVPKVDTLALLLTQGLQSDDRKVLNMVLQTRNEKLIMNTVKRLSVQAIIPLLHELCRRMHGNAQSGQVLVVWVKMVLQIHASYLMSFPEIVDTLSSLYHMMEARFSMLERLSKLEGKLDLMLSQVSSQEDENDDKLSMQPALLVYQDESSDDDAEMMPVHSESEDNWDELDDANEDGEKTEDMDEAENEKNE